MTDESPVLSKDAFARLSAELEELTTVGRRTVAERLLRARELGDLSENAEYHATKEEQGMLESRIRRLEYLVRYARVMETPVVVDEVTAGTLVTLRPLDESDAEHESYLVAGSSEERADGARTVSIRSPLGRALLGKRVGETVAYEAPGGTFRFEVVGMAPFAGSG